MARWHYVLQTYHLLSKSCKSVQLDYVVRDDPPEQYISEGPAVELRRAVGGVDLLGQRDWRCLGKDNGNVWDKDNGNVWAKIRSWTLETPSWEWVRAFNAQVTRWVLLAVSIPHPHFLASSLGVTFVCLSINKTALVRLTDGSSSLRLSVSAAFVSTVATLTLFIKQFTISWYKGSWSVAFFVSTLV